MSSKIKRLPMTSLQAELRADLEAKVERLGYLGEFFQVTGHRPAALRSFIAFTDASKQGLDTKQVEVIALAVSQTLCNHYERHQHEQLCRRLGYGDAWIAAVVASDPEHERALSADECALKHFAIAAARGAGVGAGPAFEGVVDALGSEAAVAVLMVAARYAAHALVANTLALVPPVPSIFSEPSS